MSRKKIRMQGVVGGTIAWLLLFSVQAGATQPNILFILADDVRNTSLGCAGHPIIQTPNIDRLAHNGVRFENAFVNSAICMASRATIFTGLTETSHGYTGAGWPATPVIPPDVDSSFPVLLKKAGYRTGYFGKQHVAFQEGNASAIGRMFDDFEEIWRAPYLKKQSDGSLRHTAELIGDRSEDFLKSQSKNQPFCLYMAFNIAHAEDGDHRPGIGHFPWPKSVDGMYEEVEIPAPRLGDQKYFEVQPKFMKKSLNRKRWFWRWDTPEKYETNMRAMFRMLTGMDQVIGRVLQTLEEQGLAENTVVIFTADNGYYMGDRGFAGKWSHYEQSLRVPMIVYDPRLPEGQRRRVIPQLAVNIDLPSTILDLAGVSLPEKYQGRSLLPLVEGKKPAGWRSDFFCEHHMNYRTIPKWRGVRGEQFTYACYYEQGDQGYEFLHDLEADPDQFENLAFNPEYKAVLAKMRERCEHFVEQYSRPEIVELKAEMKPLAKQRK